MPLLVPTHGYRAPRDDLIGPALDLEVTPRVGRRGQSGYDFLDLRRCSVFGKYPGILRSEAGTELPRRRRAPRYTPVPSEAWNDPHPIATGRQRRVPLNSVPGKSALYDARISCSSSSPGSEVSV